MAEFKVRDYALAWNIKEERGAVFLNINNNPAMDIKIVVQYAAELAAWETLLRQIPLMVSEGTIYTDKRAAAETGEG